MRSEETCSNKDMPEWLKKRFHVNTLTKRKIMTSNGNVGAEMENVILSHISRREVRSVKNRYLYRAKRMDNGEWVEGSLITGVFFRLGQDIPYILCPDKADYDCFDDFTEENGIFEVDTSTICQCTGLKDKHGKLIFENDVVEMYDRNTDYRWRAVVTFGNPNGEYTWGWQLKPIGECEANKDILCWIDMEESGAFCEVIGNIFDNPELLEVGE